MTVALTQAVLAGKAGEVPVGAVLVRDGRLIAQDHNRRDESGDPSAHAEVLVLRGDSYRLKGKGKELLQADAGD